MSPFKLHLFRSATDPVVVLTEATASSATEPIEPAQAVPNTGTEAVAAPACRMPQGKLGLIIARISTPDGATIEGLAKETGWQQHTLRAAISRMRRSGFQIELTAGPDGSKAYRAVEAEG